MAAQFAPVFLTEAKRDNIPLAINFDGDWIAANNAEHFKVSLLKPSVYYELLETKTHLFLTYFLFFPFAAEGEGPDNPTASLMMIVEKSDHFFNLITFRKEIAQRYSMEELELYQERPLIKLAGSDHTLHPVKKGGALEKELYHFGGSGQAYDLLRILDTLWPQRKNRDLFETFEGNIGTRFQGPSAPFAPWGLSLEAFADPAGVFLPIFCNDGVSECSDEYVENPYLQSLFPDTEFGKNGVEKLLRNVGSRDHPQRLVGFSKVVGGKLYGSLLLQDSPCP